LRRNLAYVLLLLFAGVFFAALTSTSATAEGETPVVIQQFTGWENDAIQVSAPDGMVIASITAWYGSPNDQNCGADVSAVLTQELGGLPAGVMYVNNGNFGDPCGGVFKYFWANVSYSQSVVTPTITPTSTEEPTVVPTPTETPTEKPSPTATPTEVPTETPTPTVEPTVVPTVEPTPTVSPTGEPTPAPTQSAEPTPVPSETVPVPTGTPEPSSTPQEPTVEPTSTPNLLNTITTLGLDMSPEVRAKAQRVVIATVIVAQIAQAAVAAIKRRK
jgi:hypothetical protein